MPLKSDLLIHSKISIGLSGFFVVLISVFAEGQIDQFRAAEITPAETHIYELKAQSGEYIQWKIRQGVQDLPLLAQIYDPDNFLINEAQLPISPPQPLTISIIAERSGIYRLHISTDSKYAGCYEVQLAQQRSSVDEDIVRIYAEHNFYLAEQLRPIGSKDILLQAFQKYAAASFLFSSLNDDGMQAAALTGMGRIQDTFGEKRAALEFFHHALMLRKNENNPSAKSYLYNFMTLVYDYLGERKKALEVLDSALLLAREANDKRAEGITLNNIALIHYHLGQKEKALEFYNQALPLHRAARNRRGETATITTMGAVYDSMGQKEKALEYLHQGLMIRREVGDPREIALALNNIGAVHFTRDEFAPALDYYEQALVKWREAGDRGGEAATLHNLGRVYQIIEKYEEALKHFHQALAIERSTDFRVGEGNTLTNLGTLYALLGDLENALQFYEQSLVLHREVDNRSSEASTISHMGVIYDLLGEKRKALTFFEKALALKRAVSDPQGEASTLNNLGRLHLSLNEHTKALQNCEQALPLMQSSGSKRGEAQTLICIAEAILKENPTRSLETASNALQIFHDAGDRQAEARSLLTLAKVHEAMGNLSESATDLEKSTKLIESLRTKVPGLELRSFYFASVRSYYDSYMETLMKLHRTKPSDGFDVASFEVSEKARARTLLELLNEDQIELVNGGNSSLLERQKAIRLQLNAREERLMRVPEPSPEKQTEIAEQIQKLNVELQNISEQIANLNTERTNPKTLRLQEVQEKLLDSNTILLEYALGEHSSHLWAVTQDNIHSFDLPPSRVIEQAAAQFYTLVKSDDKHSESDKSAYKLSQLLLLPAAKILQNKRILIVADGALQFIPFAALPEPGKGSEPLILNHEIIHLPSASSFALLRSESKKNAMQQDTIVVIADPVFEADDPRVTGKVSSVGPDAKSGIKRAGFEFESTSKQQKFARLIETRREAAAILALLPPNSGKVAMDFNANREAATNADMIRYRIIHFATHGILNTTKPELSGLVLSMVDESGAPRNGFLTLSDIFQLKLSAQLVVLSACQTGLGKEIKGEGLVGLSRGFLQAGTKGVLASLWKVDDRATVEWMKLFYEAVLLKKKRPAQAVRDAQIQMLNQPQWRLPYYWAGFALQGEWR